MYFETYHTSIEKILDGRNRNKIFLSGDDEFTLLIYNVMLSMGIQLAGVISKNKQLFSTDINIIDAIDLLYEDFDNIFILAAVLDGHKDQFEAFTSLGLQEGMHFELINVSANIVRYDYLDIHLGYARKDTVMGFAVSGQPETADIKIVVLGGSTSVYELAGLMAWPEILYDRLSKKCKVAVFNGAACGYGTAQESLKLLRDGINLKPDIVISLSGINDMAFKQAPENHPFVHNYQKRLFEYLLSKQMPRTLMHPKFVDISYGLENDNKDYEHWVQSNVNMNAICAANNIKFYAFLQPSMFYGYCNISEEEKFIYDMLFQTKQKNVTSDFAEYEKSFVSFFDNVLRQSSHHPFIVDLTKIFDKTSGNYYDCYHYTQIGHNAVAENIIETMEKDGII